MDIATAMEQGDTFVSVAVHDRTPPKVKARPVPLTPDVAIKKPKQVPAVKAVCRFCWEEFNTWLETEWSNTGKKPGKESMQRWYEANANAVWPDEKLRPAVSDVIVHANGRTRPKGKTAEYFRWYRLQRKMLGNPCGVGRTRTAMDAAGAENLLLLATAGDNSEDTITASGSHGGGHDEGTGTSSQHGPHSGVRTEDEREEAGTGTSRHRSHDDLQRPPACSRLGSGTSGGSGARLSHPALAQGNGSIVIQRQQLLPSGAACVNNRGEPVPACLDDGDKPMPAQRYDPRPELGLGVARLSLSMLGSNYQRHNHAAQHQQQQQQQFLGRQAELAAPMADVRAHHAAMLQQQVLEQLQAQMQAAQQQQQMPFGAYGAAYPQMQMGLLNSYQPTLHSMQALPMSGHVQPMCVPVALVPMPVKTAMALMYGRQAAYQ